MKDSEDVTCVLCSLRAYLLKRAVGVSLIIFAKISVEQLNIHFCPHIMAAQEFYYSNRKVPRKDRLHPMDSFQGTKKNRVKPLQCRCKRDVI